MDDLYSKMGDELKELFKDLFNPKHASSIQKQMDEIVKIAEKIGDPIASEAKQLYQDLHKFLKNPRDHRLINIMKKHAMKLKHETEEL